MNGKTSGMLPQTTTARLHHRWEERKEITHARKLHRAEELQWHEQEALREEGSPSRIMKKLKNGNVFRLKK